jgi:hypothetical protein
MKAHKISVLVVLIPESEILLVPLFSADIEIDKIMFGRGILITHFI